MDEERLAEIDRQIEALGQPATSVESLIADLGGLDLSEADAVLDELAEGRDIDVELAPLPPLQRVTTSVSEPPTGVSASPPEIAETEEQPAFDEPVFDEPVFAEPAVDESAFDEPEFDLPPPSEPTVEDENVLGSGLDELGKSEIPEPLSASLAAWIDPPDSETPSASPEALADMPPNPRLPDLAGGFEEEEEERTGLFSQEDIDAIRASQPPPPRSTPPPRSGPPSSSASLVGSIPPPVPSGRPRAASGPPPPIPMSVAPPADEELEILDDDDFELMIEEEALDSEEAPGEASDAISELLDVFDSEAPGARASDPAPQPEPEPEPEADEPVIREPEVETPAAAASSSEDGEAEGEESEAEGDEGEEGEKKGFFKKLFG